MRTNFELKGELIGHKGPIYHLCTDEKGHLYSSGADKLIAKWSLKDFTNQPGNIKLDHSAYSLAHCNNNLWIGSISGNIHVIDLEKRIEIKNFGFHRKPIYQCLSIKSKNQVISSDGEGFIGIWDARELKNIAFVKVHGDKIRALAFDEERDWILVGFSNGIIEAININTLNRETLIKPDSQSDSIFSMIKMSAKDVWMVAGKNGHLGCFHPVKHIKDVNIPAHNFGIYSLIELNEGKLIASASRDKSIKIWSSRDLSPVDKISVKEKGHNRSVNYLLKISETSFASAGDDGIVKIWTLD